MSFKRLKYILAAKYFTNISLSGVISCLCKNKNKFRLWTEQNKKRIKIIHLIPKIARERKILYNLIELLVNKNLFISSTAIKIILLPLVGRAWNHYVAQCFLTIRKMEANHQWWVELKKEAIRFFFNFAQVLFKGFLVVWNFYV